MRRDCLKQVEAVMLDGIETPQGRIGLRRACRALGFPRATWQRRKNPVSLDPKRRRLSSLRLSIDLAARSLSCVGALRGVRVIQETCAFFACCHSPLAPDLAGEIHASLAEDDEGNGEAAQDCPNHGATREVSQGSILARHRQANHAYTKSRSGSRTFRRQTSLYQSGVAKYLQFEGGLRYSR